MLTDMYIKLTIHNYCSIKLKSVPAKTSVSTMTVSQLRPCYEPCLLSRHLLSSHFWRGPCNATVSQLWRTHWTAQEVKT